MNTRHVIRHAIFVYPATPLCAGAPWGTAERRYRADDDDPEGVADSVWLRLYIDGGWYNYTRRLGDAL